MTSMTNAYKSTKKSFEKKIEKILNSEKSFKEIIKEPALTTNFQTFNKMIGYPINRNSNRPQEMTPYQIEYYNAIQKYHKVLLNKSRKIGATEAVIRSIALNVFGRYKGHDVMIVAGNELQIAREILIRLNELFHDKKHKDGQYAFRDDFNNKWRYDELIQRSSIQSPHPTIEFRNSTRVFSFAASRQEKSQSFRGPDDLICIFLSEAAHTGLVDDQPIMNALEPNLANRDDGDLILESTPNGKRGFFYNYWQDAQTGKNKSWHTMQWDHTEGVKYGVISQKYIQEQKSNTRIDFEQEYCCKFTSTATAAFDQLTKDNFLPPEERAIDLSTLL